MDPITIATKGQTNEEVLKANAHLINHIFNFITSMSIKCVVQLGIPDAIHRHGKPMTLSELATALPNLHPQKAKFLSRIMRILSHYGYFSYKEGAYSLTTASELLLEDHPFSVRPYALMALNPLLLNPFINLSEWFKNDDGVAPFQASNGMALWECISNRPELNKFMNGAMAGDSKMLANVLLTSNPNSREMFEEMSSLVDVGGGLGDIAREIALAYPHIKCAVLDLPHVVEGLQGTHNLSFIAGDMFKEIPPADAIFLKHVLHDWSDEHSVEILKQCKKAIIENGNPSKGQGKVIIIDIVMQEDHNEEDYKSRETQLFLDMEMMALALGKERTKREWEKLFLDAGFKGGFKIYPLLGFKSIIEVYP